MAIPPPLRSKVSTSASRWPGRKTSSASQKAISSPRASAMPRLRAAATPAFSWRDHAHRLRERGRDLGGRVARAVVDDHHLEVGVRLPERGGDRRAERRLRRRRPGSRPRPSRGQPLVQLEVAAPRAARPSRRLRPAGPPRPAAARVPDRPAPFAAPRPARPDPRARAARSRRRPTSSRRPRTLVATSGVPEASVSRAASGSPSQRDGMTTTSAAPISARASGRTPRKLTRSATSGSAASRSSCGPKRPVADDRQRRARHAARSAAIASAWFFCSTSRPTASTSRVPGSSPSSERSAGGGAGPTALTTVVSGGSPCSSSAAATPGPHATAGSPAARRRRTVPGQSSSGTPCTLDEPGRPAAAKRGETGCEAHASDCARARGRASSPGLRGEPHCAAAGTRHGRRWTSGSGSGSAFQLRSQRSGRGGDEDLMAGRARAAVGGEKHLLGTAGAELLDHVEDAHSSRRARPSAARPPPARSARPPARRPCCRAACAVPGSRQAARARPRARVATPARRRSRSRRRRRAPGSRRRACRRPADRLPSPRGSRLAGCRPATAERAHRAPAAARATSATKPWKRASTPASLAWRSSASRSEPAPKISSRTGTSASRTASIRRSIPFQYSRFAATPATSTSCWPDARIAPGSTPRGITCSRRGEKPCASRKSAIACEGATT